VQVVVLIIKYTAMKQKQSRVLLLLAILNVNGIEGFLQAMSSVQQKSGVHQFATTIEKTDEEWREILTPEQFYVLREEGTEAPNTSELNNIKLPGTFKCAGCGSPLFTTEAKFDSGTGWPSFYSPVDESAVALSTDFKLILPRTECSCGVCGGHLGHVFGDGPEPTGQRFCLNGVSMKFTSDEESPELAVSVAERQTKNPYKIGLGQVIPGTMINGIMGGLFFNSFIMKLEAGFSSPLDIFPLLPAVYFGVLAVRSCGRLSP
jgi:peptide-methionine (R)-S-oxide reductase